MQSASTHSTTVPFFGKKVDNNHVKENFLNALKQQRIKTVVLSEEFLRVIEEQLHGFKTFKYGEIVILLNFLNPSKKELMYLKSESFLSNYSTFVKMLESSRSTNRTFDLNLKRLISLYKGINSKKSSLYLNESILEFLDNSGFLKNETVKNYKFGKTDKSQYMIDMLTQYVKEYILSENEYVERVHSYIIPFLKSSVKWYKEGRSTPLIDYLKNNYSSK